MKAIITRIIGKGPMHPVLAKLLILSFGMVLGALLMVLSSVEAAPSDPEVVPCIERNSAEGETLYFCESDYGPDCLWDPSPAMRSGLLSCDW